LRRSFFFRLKREIGKRHGSTGATRPFPYIRPDPWRSVSTSAQNCGHSTPMPLTPRGAPR
jgi:hypothetical protein